MSGPYDIRETADGWEVVALRPQRVALCPDASLAEAVRDALELAARLAAEDALEAAVVAAAALYAPNEVAVEPRHRLPDQAPAPALPIDAAPAPAEGDRPSTPPGVGVPTGPVALPSGSAKPSWEECHAAGMTGAQAAQARLQTPEAARQAAIRLGFQWAKPAPPPETARVDCVLCGKRFTPSESRPDRCAGCARD